MPRYRTEVYNDALTAFFHCWIASLGAENHVAQVYCNSLIEISGGDLIRRVPAIVASVVDEHVDRPDSSETRFDGRDICQVALMELRADRAVLELIAE